MRAVWLRVHTFSFNRSMVNSCVQPRWRLNVVAGHVAPFFAGSAVSVKPTYKVDIVPLPPGVKESIRNVAGQPTNCDGCKPWMQDIAANAAQKGIGPYKWFAPTQPPPLTSLVKPLSQCKVGMLGTSGCYALGDKAYVHKESASERSFHTC